MRDQNGFADAVIVAAGSSRRMQGVDKLAQDLAGRTVLERSVEAMAGGRNVRGVILVVPDAQVESVARRGWVADCGAQVVAGGQRRQDSVAAGVHAADAEIVLIHDGARPLVSSVLVDAVADAARMHGAAIPVVPILDSLKQVKDGRIAGRIARDGVFAAQTPQGARREVLLSALEALSDGTETYTDEAELLAGYGVPVMCVPGEVMNLKVTVPADLQLARAVLSGAAADGEEAAADAAVRIGLGEDVHPFGPTMGLRLGGVEISDAPRLHGHSDGDVVLHAICDALLGAAGMPDLGRAFPADDPATRGIDSVALLTSVVAQVAMAGWRTQSIDVTILGARPKLGSRWLEAMGDAIAALLPAASVAVKASTGNLSGDEGAGRVIRATAAAILVLR